MTESIARIAGEGLQFFTISDLEHHLDLERTQAHRLAQRIVRAGLALRVRRGLYMLLSPDQWGAERGRGLDWYRVATNVVRGEPHFLAYYTAMEVHAMTQHPLRTVFVAVLRQHRDMNIGPARIRFIKLTDGKFFGAKKRRLGSGQVIEVAHLERTFIDCVDRPDLCGGIEEVYRGFARRHADITPDRLIRFLYQFAKPLVTKRIGFLLQTIGHSDQELLRELERLAGRVKRYVPLDKTAPPEGIRDRKWELIVNVDVRRLVGATTT